MKLTDSVLMIVDVQNIWAESCPKTTAHIQNFIERARNHMPCVWVFSDEYGDPVLPTPAQTMKLSEIFNGKYHSKNLFEQIPLSQIEVTKRPTNYEAKNWTDIISRWHQMPSLKPQAEDWVLSKNRKDAFSNAALASFLRDKRINTLYIAGYMEPHCIKETVFSAADKGFDTTLFADLTAYQMDYRWGVKWEDPTEHLEETYASRPNVHLRFSKDFSFT